jgi:bacteriocin biosynthesis cyclodehydratase domain-containing protein
VSSGALDQIPERPVLRPGLEVFRRDDAHLQVGIDDPRVVLTDSPSVRGLLDDLRSGAGLRPLSADSGLALQRLLDADLVVAGSEVSTSRPETLTAFARHGPAARDRLAARARCGVDLMAPEPWRSTTVEWLVGSGLAVTAASPAVTFLVSRGEPRRSLLDALVREDRPHLLVSVLADRVRLGPFVVPGVTACLRCVDAHLAEADPRRPLVLEQLEEPTGDARPGAQLHDPLLTHAALALAVREVTSYAEGDRPATWSATIAVSADLGLPRQGWRRHPHCGCSWA